MKKIIRQLAAAAATTAALSASAGTYTDLWWNPQQSGWGMNLVQQAETAFATLFVYGADGKPTWLVASNLRIGAISSGGLPVFTGTLYRTQGASHTGEWDPSKLAVVPVGELSLEALAKDRLRVHYTVDGTPVVREVVRQTFSTPQEAGGIAALYSGKFVLRQAVPGGAPYATSDYEVDVRLTFVGNDLSMVVSENSGRICEYRGPYEQAGKIARIAGRWGCNRLPPNEGTFELTDFEVNEHGFTGYLRTSAATRNEYGRIGGVRY